MGLSDEIQLVQNWLTSGWKASDLTWASEDSVFRFLGLEIMLVEGGVKIGQQAFVDQLIRRHKLQETKGYGTLARRSGSWVSARSRSWTTRPNSCEGLKS